LQTGLVLPAVGLAIPQLGLEATPKAQKQESYPEPSGHSDTGKYGKGLMHGPIIITKLNKPIIFLEVMLTGSYSWHQQT